MFAIVDQSIFTPDRLHDLAALAWIHDERKGES